MKEIDTGQTTEMSDQRTFRKRPIKRAGLQNIGITYNTLNQHLEICCKQTLYKSTLEGYTVTSCKPLPTKTHRSNFVVILREDYLFE